VVEAARQLLMKRPGLEAYARFRREMSEAINGIERGEAVPLHPLEFEPDAFK